VKASIVIPAYNEEKYIEETLKSIINQSYQNFEIIVVDCFSEDKTEKIAMDYGAKILKCRKGNIGLARRTGCFAAKGDVIVSASADTIYANDWLEKLIEPIKNGYDMTFGPVYYYNPTKIEKILTFIYNDFLTHPLTFLNIVPVCGDNLAVEKKFYFKIGGFKPMQTCEDNDLAKRAMKNGNVTYVKEAVAFASPRRFREWGAIKFISFHFKNYLKYNLMNSYSTHYEFLSSQKRLDK
jgi:glycosyltransferase involved in cell wall biosynthesis